jgi:hypothetical protein
VHRFSKTSRAAPYSRPVRAASLLWLPRRVPAPTPRRHRCFAVFSLLIILLDLVRRRVVHCTRLRTPRPATHPRCLSPTHHTCHSYRTFKLHQALFPTRSTHSCIIFHNLLSSDMWRKMCSLQKICFSDPQLLLQCTFRKNYLTLFTCDAKMRAVAFTKSTSLMVQTSNPIMENSSSDNCRKFPAALKLPIRYIIVV